MANLAILGFLEVLRPNTWLIFCMPQAILPMRSTLFLSGMSCIINIPSISDNDTLFCSELNGEHADESFKSLRFIVFEIW